jgi:hypothetical protein
MCLNGRNSLLLVTCGSGRQHLRWFTKGEKYVEEDPRVCISWRMYTFLKSYYNVY